MLTFGIEGIDLEIDDYVLNLASELDILKYDADIDIRFVDRCDADAGGYCFGDNVEVEIEIATHIQGERLEDETMMINLAHEMVHAKQLITGELVDHGIQLTTAGDAQTLVKVTEWKGQNMTNVAYDDQPWEIEAYAKERGLYERCIIS